MHGICSECHTIFNSKDGGSICTVCDKVYCCDCEQTLFLEVGDEVCTKCRTHDITIFVRPEHDAGTFLHWLANCGISTMHIKAIDLEYGTLTLTGLTADEAKNALEEATEWGFHEPNRG